MKVERRAFFEALKELARVASPKSIMPIQRHVLIRARDGQAVMRATDLEQNLICCIPAGGKLTACLPAKLLAMLVKPESKRNAGDVELEALPDGKVSVRVDDLATVLNVLDPADFPADGGEGQDWSLLAMWPAEDLRESLGYVLPASSTDETRKNLNTVFLNAGAITATDGHRLHKAPLPSALETSLLVPAPVATMLHRILPDGDRVIMAMAGENIRFGTGSWQIDARLMDMRFPDTDRVIPERDSQPTRLKLDTKVFTKALARVSKLSSGQSVKFTVNGSLVLSSQDVDTGSAETEVPTIENNHQGEDLVAGYNAGFLLDALKKSGGAVELGFSDALSPMRISREDGLLAVIMPLRI